MKVGKDKCTEVSRTKDHFLVSEPNHELIKKLRMSALSLSSPALAASWISGYLHTI